VVRRAVTDPPMCRTSTGLTGPSSHETAEQAVVSKSSHIAEEVVVGKTGSDHVETVHDTVRRQQVEVTCIFLHRHAQTLTYFYRHDRAVVTARSVWLLLRLSPTGLLKPRAGPNPLSTRRRFQAYSVQRIPFHPEGAPMLKPFLI